MATVSTFLRAIRAGAVNIKHGPVLLAHYGRLGPIFDLCTKVVIDILREEGMYNENGEIVVDVTTQALKEVFYFSLLHHPCDLTVAVQSFSHLLDSVVHSEDHSVNLAKQLASSFMIRGAQLAVVRRLDSKYIVKIHTLLLTWIIKRISTYEANKNKKQKANSVLFFRVLSALIKAVESRDALTM